jgi:hypothetical protein
MNVLEMIKFVVLILVQIYREIINAIVIFFIRENVVKKVRKLFFFFSKKKLLFLVSAIGLFVVIISSIVVLLIILFLILFAIRTFVAYRLSRRISRFENRSSFFITKINFSRERELQLQNVWRH